MVPAKVRWEGQFVHEQLPASQPTLRQKMKNQMRPPQLAASFISNARTLILPLNRPGWPNLAAGEYLSISAAARVAIASSRDRRFIDICRCGSSSK
jgi:hypothetical protein